MKNKISNLLMLYIMHLFIIIIVISTAIYNLPRKLYN